MNWTRIAALAAAAGTLATLLARASTPTTTPRVPSTVPSSALQTFSTFPAVDRLRNRSRALVASGASSRNLFAFVPKADRAPTFTPSAPAAVPSSRVAPAVPEAPAPTLIGFAEHVGPEGRVRTAIVSAPHGLYFVSIGDALADYRVTSMSEDRVELATSTGGHPVILTLE